MLFYRLKGFTMAYASSTDQTRGFIYEEFIKKYLQSQSNSTGIKSKKDCT